MSDKMWVWFWVVVALLTATGIGGALVQSNREAKACEKRGGVYTSFSAGSSACLAKEMIR